MSEWKTEWVNFSYSVNAVTTNSSSGLYARHCGTIISIHAQGLKTGCFHLCPTKSLTNIYWDTQDMSDRVLDAGNTVINKTRICPREA